MQKKTLKKEHNIETVGIAVTAELITSNDFGVQFSWAITGPITWRK